MGDPKSESGAGTTTRPPMSPAAARQRVDDLRAEAAALRDGGRERDIVWQRDYEVNKQLHAQRVAELDEAKASVELLKTREAQQREIVGRANDDIRLQEQRVTALEQRVQQATGIEADRLGVDLQEARERLENTRSVQVTDAADLQTTQARLAESTRAVEIRTGQVDALADEVLIFENSSGTWATEKARRLEAEAKALEDRAPEIEKQWEAHEAGQQPAPGDVTDLGTITVTASAADAVTEARRQRATELEHAAGEAEGRGFADRNSAEDRRELSARQDARGRELEVQIGAAERRQAALTSRLEETEGRHAQLGEQLARQEATLAQLDERGDADGAAVMRARIAQTREQMQNDEGRANSYRRDREDVQRDLEGMRTESTRVTSEAEDLRSEAEILELRAQGSLDDAASHRRVATVQDRIAAEVEQAKATGEHTRVRYVDPEDGREVTFEIPGAVTRPSGEPKEVTIDTTVPAPPAAAPTAATAPTDATTAPEAPTVTTDGTTPDLPGEPGGEDEGPDERGDVPINQTPSTDATEATGERSEPELGTDERSEPELGADEPGEAAPGTGEPREPAPAADAATGEQSPTTEATGAEQPATGTEMPDPGVEDEESSRGTAAAPAAFPAASGPVTTAAADLSLTLPAAAAYATGSQDWDFTVDPATTVVGSSGLDLSGGGDPLDPSLLRPGDLAAEGEQQPYDPTFDDGSATPGDAGEATGYGEAPYEPAGVTLPEEPTSGEDTGTGVGTYDQPGFEDSSSYGDSAGYGASAGYGETSGYADTGDYGDGGTSYEDAGTYEDTAAEPFADS